MLAITSIQFSEGRTPPKLQSLDSLLASPVFRFVFLCFSYHLYFWIQYNVVFILIIDGVHIYCTCHEVKMETTQAGLPNN